MDYRLLFAICLVNICWQIVSSKLFTFEVENFASAELRVPRSSASGKFTVHLHKDDLVQVEFCLGRNSLVSIQNVVYSNDGNTDIIHVSVDGQNLGTFQTSVLEDDGNGWNRFKSSKSLHGKAMLPSGRHVIDIKAKHTDQWGVEIDHLILSVDDNLLNEEYIACNFHCFDIKYDLVPREDKIPSGKFLQKSTATQCSEQDNVKIEIYHDTATSFEIIANLPKYVSFANNRDPNYNNCKLASPYWIFRDQEVSASVPEVRNNGAIMRSSRSNNKITKLVTFDFGSLTPTRELDERLISSALYMKLRNMPRENVRVQVEYLKNRRWIKFQEKEFTPFDNEGKWSIPERSWNAIKKNQIRLIMEPGKQKVVIETLKLQRTNKPDSTVQLYSDHDTVFQGVKLGFWHHWNDRPNSMTVIVRSGVNGFKQHFRIDSIRVYTRVPWADGYAQVFVMFQDGRTRLQAITPHGLDYIPFGSSVNIGQPASKSQERPYSPIDVVHIDPKALKMDITYVDGSRASFTLKTTYKQTKLIVSDAKFNKNRQLYPIMTFQSMWVHNGNAHVDHMTVNGDISRPITSNWNQLYGISAVFFKKCISEHNTQAPDITIMFK